jgi:carbonic anhydrase
VPETPLCEAAAEALRRLREGNDRFLAGTTRLVRSHAETIGPLVHGQRPCAMILCCSDSRVPPEIVFDAGLGDLFVVRVAGNVLSAEVAGTFQYAAVHLGTPLFVVLGHEGCGAVQAALAAKLHGTRERSRIETLLQGMMPGLEGVDEALPPEARLAAAVEANVRWTMRQILETPEARAREAEGRLKLVGAVAEITTGVVRFLE